MSGDPHVIARNVRATRSTVEAIAAHLGIELNGHGEPVETRPATLTKDELDALPLYAAVLCVDEYRHVYLALKVGTPQGSGGHTWRTTDYTTIPGSGRLAGDNAVLLDRGLTALVLMGFAQDAARAATPVQADALTGTDQVPDVVHARHAPVVGHSRHGAPRDIPSSVRGPATTPAMARATEEVKTLWLHEEVDLASVARAALSAALSDPDDLIARAIDAAIDAHDTDHERDHTVGECVREAVQAATLGARGEEVVRG